MQNRLIYKGILLVSVLIILHTQQAHQQSQQSEVLKAATIVFRHGDRNPVESYPGDPYKNASEYWPEGYGALTTMGKVRMYNLGRYMRRRYPNFQRKNVLVYSSDTNRTISSAMATLAGFYGQNRSFLRHLDSYNVKGFGITIVPKDDDDFILITQPCPQYEQLLEEYLQNNNPMDKYKDAVETIYENTGLNFSQFKYETIVFADTVMIQKSKNLTLPKWAEDLYKDDIFQEIRNEYFENVMPTPKLKKLQTGAMIKRFLDEMDKVILEAELQHNKKSTPNNNFPKIAIISGHDVTLSHWMIDFDVFDWNGPPYGAALFMELYEPVTPKRGFIFKVFYKNDSNLEAYQLSLPGCRNPCYYNDLKRMLLPLVIENRVEECSHTVNLNTEDVETRPEQQQENRMATTESSAKAQNTTNSNISNGSISNKLSISVTFLIFGFRVIINKQQL